MPISIECPACDESFAVADSGAGKKVACPRCGNINRIPGMKSKGEPAGEKAAEQNSQLNVAKRLSDDGPATPAAPPRQPPQLKPPVAPSQDDLFIVSDDDSKPSVNRESETSSPPSERRRKRKKTPSAVLWGTIALGGIAVISLALYTNNLEKKKLQKAVAKRKPAANTTMNSDAQTEPGQQPVRANDQEKVDQPSPNEEPFAP
ncbi:MAG: MJ0042-type zinc finger domain-containing protein, partial [Pirellulaceae bacterium]